MCIFSVVQVSIDLEDALVCPCKNRFLADLFPSPALSKASHFRLKFRALHTFYVRVGICKILEHSSAFILRLFEVALGFSTRSCYFRTPSTPCSNRHPRSIGCARSLVANVPQGGEPGDYGRILLSHKETLLA